MAYANRNPEVIAELGVAQPELFDNHGPGHREGLPVDVVNGGDQAQQNCDLPAHRQTDPHVRSSPGYASLVP